MIDGLVHRVIGHIVGGGLGAQQEMIPNILFDEPMAIVTADNGIGQMPILDHRL